MNVRRTLAALALATAALAATAWPALAASNGDGLSGNDPFVVLTGTLVVPGGSAVSDAVILNGDATIDGDVRHQVVALNGDVTISGSVGENVIALNGHVTVADGAHVGGDIESRHRPTVAAGATVDGQLRRIGNLNVNVGQLALVSRILVWLATSVSSFLLGLLLVLFVPRGADATARTAIGRFGASVGFGAIAFFAIPIAAIVAIVTLVGIPIGVGVLLALGFLDWLGYTVGAFALGRRLVAAPTHRLLAFLAGWGILRAIALIPVLGGLTWLAVTVWGLGSLVVSGRAAGRADAGTPTGATPVASGVPPIPPPPPGSMASA